MYTDEGMACLSVSRDSGCDFSPSVRSRPRGVGDERTVRCAVNTSECTNIQSCLIQVHYRIDDALLRSRESSSMCVDSRIHLHNASHSPARVDSTRDGRVCCASSCHALVGRIYSSNPSSAVSRMYKGAQLHGSVFLCLRRHANTSWQRHLYLQQRISNMRKKNEERTQIRWSPLFSLPFARSKPVDAIN